MNVGPMQRLLNETRAWAQQTKRADGGHVIDQPWVQANLARLHANLEVLELMNWKQAWAMQNSNLHPADASAIKVFGSEFYVEAYRLILEVMGPLGAIQADSPGAVLRGRVEMMYRNALILTFGGGTNEVQRDIIAMAGLGMPHYKN
jgi:alkylation response protein AidB-like acyl-CoA dehydrogenase